MSRARLPRDDVSDLVRDCAADLKVLDGANLLLTGATGWFGIWLLDVLLTARDLLSIRIEITALSRDPAAFVRRNPGFAQDAALRWLQGDVRTFSAGGFSYVIHAATDASANAAGVSARDMFETVLHGTERALAAAGPACRGFLLFSSGAIYGSHPALVPYAEEMTLGPDPSLARSSYAEAKRAAETVCAIAAEGGVPARIARCFAFVGPHMPFDRHFAIGNFIADALQGRPITIRSDGSPLRSYLYMTDLVRASLRILIRGRTARPYNVGSNQAISVRELADTVNSLLGGRGVVMAATGDGVVDRYVPDTSRLRNELNFEPKVNLADAILKTAAWYRTQIL